MARPSVTHDGFLIPNAADVTNPRMAEPDRIDFNTLAQGRWGVIEGCLVTVSTKMALVADGLVVVNGQLTPVSAGSVPIGTTALDRFDLIVVDQGGTILVIKGVDTNDPVFPDVPVTNTVLAAVFAPAGVSDYSSNVTDKRKFLSKALLTKIPPGDPLVYNKNNTGVHYQTSGAGDTWWEGDTRLWRSNPHELSIDQDLKVLGDLNVGDDITCDALTGTGRVQGSNLVSGSTLPGTATPGTIYQDDSGHIYVWRNGAWKELATLDATSPVGTIIQSIQAPSVMQSLGWVALNGATITEAQYGSLFTIPALAGNITGTAPNRSMVLPKADGKVMVTQWGVTPGTTGGNQNSNTITLGMANMPKHRHNVAMTQVSVGPLTGSVLRNGIHSHAVTGGDHGHPQITDPGHAHHGMDLGAGSNIASAVIGLLWGGPNKIDALFNDRNHTYSVERMEWTMPAYSNITIGSAGSAHGHNIIQDGDHDHQLRLDNILPHDHPVSEQDMGASAAFDITPAYLAVYSYIKA